MGLSERDDALDKKLEASPIEQTVAALQKEADRRNWQIRGLFISLIIDVFLTVGLAAVAIQARDTALSAARSQASIIASCQTGNEFKTTEAALWNHIIDLSANSPSQQNLTPEQEAQRQKILADFQTYLKTTFAPRDCNNVIQK